MTMRAALAVILTAGFVWAGSAVYVLRTADSAPAPRAEICEPGEPRSADGTCGLSWDDIRNQPIQTGQGK